MHNPFAQGKFFSKTLGILLVFACFLGLQLFVFTDKVQACAEDGIPIPLDGCVQATYCGGSGNNAPYTCEGTCQSGSPPSNQVWQRTVLFDYADPNRTDCSSTVYFKTQSACNFTQLNQQATNLQCSTPQKIGTCNRAHADANPNQFVFTGSCDTNQGVYCVGTDNGSKAVCSNTNAGAEGDGLWCVQYDCFACNASYQCQRVTGGSTTSLSSCQSGCVPPACTGCNADTSCSRDGTTTRYGVDSCGNQCSVSVPACPTYTPTPTPVPGNLSCGLSANAVSSDDQGACPSDQYCVQLFPSYSGDNIGWPINQSWNFGDGTGGFNNSTYPTYKRYPRGSGSRTVSLGATETTNAGRSCNTSTVINVPASTPTGGGGGGGGGGGTGPGCDVCSAPQPGCGGTTWGKCGDGVTDCSKNGPACDGESTQIIKFFNADGRTQLTKNITINFIGDRRTGSGGWFDNRHGPYSPYFRHWTAGGNVCERNEYHTGYDAGWQLISDGSVAVGPPGNLDAIPGMYQVCDEQREECSDCCGCTGVCVRDHWEEGNDQCIIGMANTSQYATFYSPGSATPGSIGAYPNNKIQNGESGSYDFLRNDIQYSWAIGAPSGYKIRVVEGCSSDYDGGCAAATGNAAYLYQNGGRVVKDYNQGGPGGLLNLWQIPYQRVNSNAFFLAYDIHISGPEDEVFYHNISGNAYIDANCDGASEGAIPGGARINLTGTQNRVTGTDGAGNWAINTVLAGPGQSHRIDVIPNDSSTIWRTCGGTNGTSSITYTNPDASNKVFNVGFAPVYGPWFQVRDADLFANGNIVSRIPTTCTPAFGCNPYFELNGGGNYPGVPMYAASLTLGVGNLSTTGWRTNTTYQGTQYNYNTLNALIPAAVTFNTIGGGAVNWSNLTTGTPYNGYYWQRRTGDLSISGGNVGAGRAVLFVQGNLYINSDVSLAPGSGFLAVVVSGNIYIAPGVTNLNGLFLANGNIFTGAGSSRLNVTGALVGWGGITLQRDLDPSRTSGANNTGPAEVITAAPDLLMNFPKEMMRDSLTWREIAP